jgi:hypothetical protein
LVELLEGWLIAKGLYYQKQWGSSSPENGTQSHFEHCSCFFTELVIVPSVPHLVHLGLHIQTLVNSPTRVLFKKKNTPTEPYGGLRHDLRHEIYPWYSMMINMIRDKSRFVLVEISHVHINAVNLMMNHPVNQLWVRVILHHPICWGYTQ